MIDLRLQSPPPPFSRPKSAVPLRYLRFPALDLAAWDACVAAAAPALPYATAWWLRAAAGRWDAVVELDDATGAYLSVLPLPTRRRPWGREAVQPPFTQQLGLFTTPASQHRKIGEYLVLISRHYARSYQQLNVDNSVISGPPGYLLTKRITYVLPLTANYETLLADYAADYRRRLRLNQRRPQPLATTATTSAAAIIRLFRAEKAAAGLPARAYRRLHQLVAALQVRNALQILEVRQPDTGELLAGALFVRHADRLIYLFAAAAPAGRPAGAPLLLLDAVIRRHAGTPGLVLDFEGSMMPSVARFFANFGAAPVPYLALTQTYRPWYLAWLT